MSPRLDEATVAALFGALVDDAAVFPPGLAPLPRAVAEHVARTAYARFVGPLLVPATAAADVLALADGSHLRVGLIARPGMPVGPVREGALLVESSSVELAGVEVGAASDWAGLLDLAVPVTVEIPRDGFVDALDAVAAASERVAGLPPVQAKFRTGATETWAWPDEDELARFLAACHARGLAFKLTGGLHHVLRADHPGPAGGPQHGLLNVLVAVAELADGSGEQAARDALAQRAAAPLVERVSGFDPDLAGQLRGRFTAYGCCDVLDPIRELVALDLLDEE
jgi:hypothetical protein